MAKDYCQPIKQIHFTHKKKKKKIHVTENYNKKKRNKYSKHVNHRKQETSE